MLAAFSSDQVIRLDNTNSTLIFQAVSHRVPKVHYIYRYIFFNLSHSIWWIWIVWFSAIIKYVHYEEKNLKYIKWKEERMQNAFCVYTASDITSSINKLQLGALRFFNVLLKRVPKSHFRLLKLRFLRIGDYLSPKAGKGWGGGGVGIRLNLGKFSW